MTTKTSEITTTVSTLPNGLRVVSDRIATVETVTLGVWLNVGTRHETKEINGIAHMLEHMAFKGTKRRNAREIAEEIEAVGGYLNAYTAREVTAYHARILKEDVGLAVDILADILQNSTFDAEEFTKEQSVIIQEIGQSNDTPDDVVFDYFQETCFPNQPMGWPTLGTVDVIKSLKPETVKKYMADHYGAKQMVLAAAGNIDHAELVKLAEEHFKDLPADRSVEKVPSDFQGGDFRLARELEQVHIVFGFEGLPYGHPDYYTMMILSTLLGGGMSSRLFQEVREKRGLVYSIQSHASSYRDSGVFTVYAGTGAEEIKELIPVVLGELKKLSTTLTDAEIKRSKAQLKAGMMMGMEGTSSRCERLAHQMLVYGRPIPSQETLEKISAVTKESIAELADKIFSQKPTLTALGPIENVASYEEVLALL